MLRERVAGDIYVFRSEMYLQVTAGVIVTEEGAVIVDTLPFPQETVEAARICPAPLSPGHSLRDRHPRARRSHPRQLSLQRRSAHQPPSHRASTWSSTANRAWSRPRTRPRSCPPVQLRLPEITFDSMLILRLGGKTITLRHSPGHSPDVITVRVKEDKVLFASDTILPVPYLDFPGGGNIDDLRRSLRAIEIAGLENVVQGHGEVLLRGEIRNTINSSLKYLDCIEELGRAARAQR